MSTKKITQVHETVLADSETGEVLKKQTATNFYINREPEYIKLYLADILYLNDLQTNQAGLLFELLKKMNYDNQIVLNAHIKKEIAQTLNCTVGTIDNNLNKFVQGKILQRIGRGVYEANAYLFGKGEWKDILEKRNSNFHLAINYTENGRSFQMSLSERKIEEPPQKSDKLNDVKESENDVA